MNASERRTPAKADPTLTSAETPAKTAFSEEWPQGLSLSLLTLWGSPLKVINPPHKETSTHTHTKF